MTAPTRSAARLLGALAVAVAAAALAAPGDWSPTERRLILGLGPWPPAPQTDSSNRASGRASAIELGGFLFTSARLSADGSMRCAACHEPWRSFTDGRATSQGLAIGRRNTLSLWNVASQTWFGWDGANDSLWAQSLRALLDRSEMGTDAQRVSTIVRGDSHIRELYRAAFGEPTEGNDEVVMVNVAKSLAAFQETLVSPRAPFDAYRDALVAGDLAGQRRYPKAARDGLAIFIGKGGCASCHSGALFSDGQFHRASSGTPSPGARPDQGRLEGLRALAASRYNLLGPFSDALNAVGADRTRAVLAAQPIAGFRTPGLREVTASAPYMHDGSVATLCAAIDEHAVSESRPTVDEAHRADVVLSRQDKEALVAFLRSLSGNARYFSESKGSGCPD